MFNIYTDDVQGLEDRADKYIKEIDDLDEESHELFLEQSAYSPFEFKWRMARLETYVWETTGKLHHLNEVAVKNAGHDLPAYITAYLVDRMTGSPTYDKCIVCGKDIADGHGNKDTYYGNDKDSCNDMLIE
jgi:hypothetical protein